MSRFARLTIGLLTALLLAAPSYGDSPFDGHWTLNAEETDKVAAKYEDGSGMKGHDFGRPRVTVMGIPVPGTARPPAQGGIAARDPLVLRCASMEIAVDGEAVPVRHFGIVLPWEVMRKGDFRGRKTRVSRSTIRQKYKTSSRTVTKTWELRADGRLLVLVKLNPKQDKARTFARVFDRIE